MNIKQIGEYNGNIVDTILKNRGIENRSLFLSPTDQDDTSALKFKNIDMGIEMFLAHIITSSKIGLVVDADADGITSSSIMYQYIKKIKEDTEVIPFFHNAKAHGLTEEIMEKISNEPEIDLVIIPDAGSNDLENIKVLIGMDIDVLIIDHHEVEKETEFGILINNQLEGNIDTNRNLVGAGMVLRFCEAVDSKLNYPKSDNFYDLAAIGQIGDGSDISQNEVRNMVFNGLNQISNPFVKVVLEDMFGSLENLAPINLSFSIIPLINSIVRVGTLEEKEHLFNAINGNYSEEPIWVVKRKKNKETGKFDKIDVAQSYPEYVYDICKKVKGRQKSMTDKMLKIIDEDIDNSTGIIISVLDTLEYAPITGLIANKIVSKYQKPTLILQKKETEDGILYVGSGRGNTKVLKSLKDWCNNTDLVDFAQGHANAFGIQIQEKNFKEFKELTKDVEYEEFVYEVDALIENKPDAGLILDIVDNIHLFGGKVNEPLIAFTNIKVNKSFIRQRGSMLKFFDNGVEFVMFGAPDGLFEDLTHNFDQYIEIDVVGRASKNSWGFKETPQLILEDCEKSQSPTIDDDEEITVDTIVF